MIDVFEQIKQELKDNSPIFDSVSNTLRPLIQSSEIIGGLKALMALNQKLTEHGKNYKTLTTEQLLTYIDQIREETVRNRRG